MKRLAIIGAAELGMLVQYFVQEAGAFRVTGFFDDVKKGDFNGLPVLGPVDSVADAFGRGQFDELFIAIGYNHMGKRSGLFERFQGKIPFATFVHRSAFIDPSSRIGTGSIFFPGCVVDQSVQVGNNVLLNTAVSISHHSTVGDHCFLSPRVAVAGRVTIGPSCFLGIGSIIRDLVTVGTNATVGAGSLVLEDVDAHSISYGSPSKTVRYKENP